MTKRFLLCGACCLLPMFAAAQPVAGPYVDLGGGVNFLENQIEKPFAGYGPSKRTYTFDPGATGYAGLGYSFASGLRVEAEGDFINNVVKGVKLSSAQRAGGHEHQYGGLLNVLYDFKLNLPVIPYVGVGAGYQEVALDNINASYYGEVNNSKGAESHGEFAYQGIAGLSYPVPFLPGLALTIDYRFLGVITPAPYPRSSNGRNHVYVDGVLHQYRDTFSNILNNEITMGVRYTFGSPPLPPPAPVAPLPVAPAPAPSRTYLVFFDWDRADLTIRARQIVAEAATASTHVQTTRIEVNGYTDLSGTAVYNKKLSVRRAQSVEAELVRDGVAQSEIGIHGYGESNPLVPTAKGVREPQNRRVEIILK